MSDKPDHPAREPLPSIPSEVSRSANTDETVMRRIPAELLQAARRSDPDTQEQALPVPSASRPSSPAPTSSPPLAPSGKDVEALLKVPKPSDFRPSSDARRSGASAVWRVMRTTLLLLLLGVVGASVWLFFFQPELFHRLVNELRGRVQAW